MFFYYKGNGFFIKKQRDFLQVSLFHNILYRILFFYKTDDVLDQFRIQRQV